MSNKITVKMEYSKSTKNKHVYKNADSAIQALYIEKSALPSNNPKELEVDIRWK